LSAEVTFSSDVSEKTDSDSTVVTVVTRESNSVIVDDEQSLFSVDQDGFFTSMHTDSGLAAAASRPAAITSTRFNDSSISNTSSDTRSVEIQQSLANNNDSSNSDVVSVTALTMQLSSSFALPVTDSKLDVGDRSLVELCGENVNRTFAAGNDRTCFRSASAAAAFPSFCTVTPPSSDDEDIGEEALSDRTDCDWSSVLSPSTAVSTPLPPVATTTKHDTSADASLLDSYTLAKIASKVHDAETSADGKFSTWPCSPVPGNGSSLRGILKSKSDGAKCQQLQKFIKFSPVVSASQKASCNCGNSESHSEVKSSLECDQTQELDVEDANSRNVLQSQSNDCTLLSEQALFEGAALNEDKVGETSAVETSATSDPSTSDAGISAAIVISSPVIMQSTYIENTHRRLVCRPVRPDEWQQFNSYTSKNQWSRTLPRNMHMLCGTASECIDKRSCRRSNSADRSNVQLQQQRVMLRDSQLTGDTVYVAQQSDAIAPLTMLHSPRRYGIDGREESLQTSDISPTADRDVTNSGKVAGTTAMLVKPFSTLPPKNTGQLKDSRYQHALSLHLISNNVQQLPSLPFEGSKKLQKPNAKLKQPEVIPPNKNEALSSKDVVRSPCSQSLVCRRDISDVDCCSVIQLLQPSVELQPAASTDTSSTVGSKQTITTDACDGALSDDSSDCSQNVRINSAAVYNHNNNHKSGSECEAIARSSDSISSTLSAAERSRAAKFAFLGFSVDECCDEPLPPTRTDETSVSSGLGSSVSGGSPVVSPDCNEDVDPQTRTVIPACPSCSALALAAEQRTVKYGVKRTLPVPPLTERSKQTAV